MRPRRNIAAGLPWYLLAVVSMCLFLTMSLGGLAGLIGGGDWSTGSGSDTTWWSSDSSDSGSDWSWDSGGSDSGSWDWDSGSSDSGSWDSWDSGSDSGSWDSFDSGGSDSGGW